MSNEPTMSIRAWWTLLGACAIAATFTVIMFNRQPHPAPQPTPSVSPSASATVKVESYPACREDAAGNVVGAPCVWDNSADGYRLYTLVRGDIDGASLGEDFPDCRTEDDTRGSLGCVWDTATRGNGQAGPGVSRFLVNRQ